MYERWFVLAPLCELDPAYRHPLDGRNACDALARLERAIAARRPVGAEVVAPGVVANAGERTALPW